MIGRYRGQVVRVVSAVMSPFIMMLGLYVIAHGHYGPGGGFAGGVVLAVGVILLRITADEEPVLRRFPPGLGVLAGGIGLILFMVVGLAPMLFGEAFLDYAGVPVTALDDADLRYLGILVVEIAVGLAVFGTMLAIFDVITGTLRDENRAEASR